MYTCREKTWKKALKQNQHHILMNHQQILQVLSWLDRFYDFILRPTVCDSKKTILLDWWAGICKVSFSS